MMKKTRGWRVVAQEGKKSFLVPMICYVVWSVVGFLVWEASAQAQSLQQQGRSPEKAEGKASSKSQGPRKVPADQDRSQRLHIHFDQPTFRKISLVLATKNVSSTDISEASSAKIDVALKSFMNHLSELLQFSSLFQVRIPSLYVEPFFSWPQRDQSVEEWTRSKPEITAKDQRKLDGVVMAQVLERGGGGFEYRFFVVDLFTYKVRAEKVYRSVAGLQAAELREWALDLADEIMLQFTGKSGIFSTRLVFVGRKTAKSPKHIYTARIDGSDLRQITTGSSIHLSPSWSHGGTHIIFTSYRSGDPDLYAYHVASGATHRIAGYPGVDSGGQGDPTSDYVAFSGVRKGDTDIYLTTLTGKKRRPLIRGPGLDVDPTFSPDGGWLAFVSGRFGNPHIFIAQLQRESGGRIRVLKDRRLTFAGWYNATPAFSPDGKKIVFAGYDREINRFDLFLMNRDGRNLERLTLRSGDNESPSFSPRGQFIVFASNRRGTRDLKGPSGLYLMRKDGSGQRKIPLPLYSAYTPRFPPAKKAAP